MKSRKSQCPGGGIQGLTLGEMLIVLAVFSILATMFMMSSQYAIQKSKYSRVLQDQRTVVSAIESHMAEYMAVPSESQGLGTLLHGRNPYINFLPTDLFRVGVAGQAHPGYAYYTDIADGYNSVIVSAGPDGDLDIGPAIEKARKDTVGLAGGTRRMLFKTPEEARLFIVRYSYDPTNGVNSDGDVIAHYGY